MDFRKSGNEKLEISLGVSLPSDKLTELFVGQRFSDRVEANLSSVDGVVGLVIPRDLELKDSQQWHCSWR